MTTLRDGTKEEGKYKCNVLITSKKKKHLFLIRSAKFRERVEASVSSSQRASKYALQKADIAVSRTSTARSKGDMADTVADHAKVDSEVAVATAREFAPDFKPSVLDRFDRIRDRERFRPMNAETTATTSAATATVSTIPSPVKHQPNQHLPHSPPPINEQNRVTPNYNHPQPVTPVKQAQFAPQPTIRRTSMMHKQESFDFAANQGQQQTAIPNHLNYPSSVKTQQQQAQQLQQQQQHHHLSANNQPSGLDSYATNNHRGANQQMENSYGATNNYQNDQFNINQRNNLYDQQKPAMYNAMDASAISQGYNDNNYVANNTNDQNFAYGSPQQQQQQYSHQQQMNAFQAAEQHPANLYQMDGGMAPHMNHINSQPVPSANQQGIDHFDHYKRVPSRDSSMDRYARAASRLGGGSGSRQPSMDRQVGMNNAAPVPTKEQTPEKRLRSDSVARMSGAAPSSGFGGGGGGGGGCVGGGGGAAVKRASISSFQPQASPTHTAIYSSPNQPFEDVLLRQRTLGQDIIPSPREPKRTESLYLPPKPLIGNGSIKGGGGGGKQLKVSNV